MNKNALKKKYAEKIAHFGTQDASDTQQKDLAEILALFKKRGWKVPEVVLYKQMNECALKNHINYDPEYPISGTCPDVIIRGNELLYTTCFHEQSKENKSSDNNPYIFIDEKLCRHYELTPEESKQLLASRVARLALAQHKLINPHWYTNQIVIPGSIFCSFGAIVAAKKYLPKAKFPPAALMIFGIAGLIVKKLLCGRVKYPCQIESYGPDISTHFGANTYAYKSESIISEIIAAWIMPNGIKNSISLCEKEKAFYYIYAYPGFSWLLPSRSTRLKYLKAIKWAQEINSKNHD